MRRRQFIAGLTGALATWPLHARAKPATEAVIGFLDAGSAAISQQIDWWFPNVEWIPDERRSASTALIDRTASWLESIHTDIEAATS